MISGESSVGADAHTNARASRTRRTRCHRILIYKIKYTHTHTHVHVYVYNERVLSKPGGTQRRLCGDHGPCFP